jgi:DNA mismatch endonuclease (patch repair protein)
MKGNRRVDTKPEALLRSRLHAAGLRFRKDYPIRSTDGSVRPDIVFTRARLAVFVDGCFWHLCPEHGRIPGGKNTEYWDQKLRGNAARDQINTKTLSDSGWIVLRIWEHEDIDVATQAVLDALG